MFNPPGGGCGGGAVREMGMLSCSFITLSPGDFGLGWGVLMLNPTAQTFQFGGWVWVSLVSSWQVWCCPRAKDLRTTLVLPKIFENP